MCLDHHYNGLDAVAESPVATQVLPLDAMCGSVKSSMSQAMRQHLAVKDLTQSAVNQFNGWALDPNDSYETIGDVEIATPHAMRVKRSTSDNPLTCKWVVRAPADSDSSTEASEMCTIGRRFKGCHAKRMYSLPVENCMSTRDLLSTEEHTPSSSEVRLDVNP